MKSAKWSIKKRFWLFITGIILLTCSVSGIALYDKIYDIYEVSDVLDTAILIIGRIGVLGGICFIIIYLLIIAFSWISSFTKIPIGEKKQNILEHLTQIDSVISPQLTPKDLLIILNDLRIIELELQLSDINGPIQSKLAGIYNKIKNLDLTHTSKPS